MTSLNPVVSQGGSTSGSDDALVYLRHHDDPMRWEVPRMFNRCAELRRLHRFVHDLEAKLGRRVDYDSTKVDDACHGEVFLEGATVRFSNFGRMVAVLDDPFLSPRSRRLLAALAAEHGYIIIPAGLLSLPYSGTTAVAPPRETWGSRFFGAR